MGKWTPLIALGLLLAFWIIAACAAALVHRVRATAGAGLWAKLRANSASYYGMHLAHVGIAVVVIGITLVRGYETERDVRMQPGDAVTERDGRVVETLHPEKRTYFASGQTMTEAAIDSGFTRDLYVSLGEPVGKELNGAWAVRIYVKPFIDWIWAGCILMALGGAFAIGDKRYRLRTSRKRAEDTAGGSSGAVGTMSSNPLPANVESAPRGAE
jgi:cytochrome c-type biogenesis protein CcmF